MKRSLFVVCGRDVYTGDIPDDHTLRPMLGNALLRLYAPGHVSVVLTHRGCVGMDADTPDACESMFVYRVAFIGGRMIDTVLSDAERAHMDAVLQRHGVTWSPVPAADHYWLELLK